MKTNNETFTAHFHKNLWLIPQSHFNQIPLTDFPSFYFLLEKYEQKIVTRRKIEKRSQPTKITSKN